MQYNSINEGSFLKSLGFQEICDADHMSLPVMGIRDTRYFEKAERMIAEHRKTDKRPLFVLVQTMFTHSPYENTLEPKVAGEHIYAADAGANENLRRIIWPIALRQGLAVYGREAILMIKATSLASIITLTELTGIARKLISSTDRVFEFFIVTGAI
jgi:hypothetical protein